MYTSYAELCHYDALLYNFEIYSVMDNKFSSVKFYIRKSCFLHLWCINVFRAEAQGTGGSSASTF